MNNAFADPNTLKQVYKLLEFILQKSYL